jgi:D-threo-aldose 1-dehydrogenase
MLADFARDTDMDLLMLAGRYTLLDQSALDDLFPACDERGMRVVAAGVYNSGVLARPRPTSGAKYDYTDVPEDVLRRAERIDEISRRRGVELPAAALAFPLAHPVVASVCVGARSPEQIERNAALYRSGVPAELWADLRAEGLLRADAPTESGGR